MKITSILVFAITALPAVAQERRALDAHEHGVGALNIVFDGASVAMQFEAPGADIVGFEYQAETEEDRAAIDDAVAILAKPLELFALSTDAHCNVTQARAALTGGTRDEDHGDHSEHNHEDHAHDDHHDEHHEGDAHIRHSGFQGEYLISCGNPDAHSGIGFPYFEVFENARELEVQILTPSGAQAFEVTREAPILDIRGMF